MTNNGAALDDWVRPASAGVGPAATLSWFVQPAGPPARSRWFRRAEGPRRVRACSVRTSEFRAPTGPTDSPPMSTRPKSCSASATVSAKNGTIVKSA